MWVRVCLLPTAWFPERFKRIFMCYLKPRLCPTLAVKGAESASLWLAVVGSYSL